MGDHRRRARAARQHAVQAQGLQRQPSSRARQVGEDARHHPDVGHVALGIAVNLWGVLATSIFSWATY